MEPNNDAQHPPAPPAQPDEAAGTHPLRLLDQVAVGWPVSREGLSFFPLYLAANELPAMLTGADSGLDIGELDMPEVRALKARNPRDKPVLLVEGEHFVGGDQNRSVNVTVLVSAGSELEIPVRAWSGAAGAPAARRGATPRTAPTGYGPGRARAWPSRCGAAVRAAAIRGPCGRKWTPCSRATTRPRPPLRRRMCTPLLRVAGRGAPTLPRSSPAGDRCRASAVWSSRTAGG